jgi:hypothetical protein
MKITLRLITVGLLSFLVTWNGISLYTNEGFVARVRDAQLHVDAIADAQDFSMPLIGLSEQLARENAMFTEVIDRARDIVTTKELELAQTKESLNSSIELLQEQIVENNRCVDEIRSLEDRVRMLQRTVDKLVSKIPDSVDVEYPYDPTYNN